ncbi:peptide/nickel transport system ATP-binding protein/oligopeptide transport system ATP-binding protein [Halobacillus alkaliphilus]|uniref:Peptide/nickel transport system ATP-binding protein/oligopeptide transport system ATP-binding protein n=1 Tax=Halobacillus alkaliphilus TaxID=396056 RepID=A0A1I2QCR5_9BACI|nr:dipeptide ABC transporter ATP-binding protein [Halobacillus alkaliphilus]SFG25443.1 peptide/nickel transport system ATP-binding protein/oligopeptide transport system ATP-binding protein [Halobacillus alkaliphilus]
MSLKTEPILEVSHVKKYFPVKSSFLKKTVGNVQAVENVSVDVREGETLGVVGESGCGKSTFGRTVLGLDTLTEGSIKFRGEEIGGLSDRQLKKYKKEMQMIFQDPYASLNPRQRVGEALEEAFIIHTKLSKAERVQRVKDLLKEVGLKEEHAERYPHEFSGGQRQRIGIARAVSLNPSLIVCDEAVSALDVSVQAQIIKLLKELQHSHQLTYLFISHDLGVVRHICDRVLVMYLGATMELAPAEELFANPLHPYTQALLSAIPRPVPGRKKERIKLQGDLPNPANYPSGCPFHTRCPLAHERCRVEVPEWREVQPDHFVACHEV